MLVMLASEDSLSWLICRETPPGVEPVVMYESVLLR